MGTGCSACGHHSLEPVEAAPTLGNGASASHLVEACAALEEGVENSSAVEELQALRERIVNDVVKKIDLKVGALSEFNVTVTTLAGAEMEIVGLRPEELLSSLHARTRKELGSEGGHLQLCLETRVFRPEESGRTLSSLGIGRGAVLTCVASRDVPFAQGDTLAALCWLSGHAELNGTMVRVLEYHEESKRFEVRAVESGQLFRVKRENLLMRPAGEWPTGTSGLPISGGGLRPGARVRIFGLKTMTFYNGATGAVVEVDASRCRYSIQFEDGSVRIVRGQNLELLQTGPPSSVRTEAGSYEGEDAEPLWRTSL